MSIALHTRSLCDECGDLAFVEHGVNFLCAACFASNSEVPVEQGTAPAAPISAPVSGPAGATNFNSGDVLGNLEPGSKTWGEGAALTAPSGRADKSAACPDVAGTPNSDPMHLSSFPPASETCATARPPLAVAPFSSDFEAEVSALEAARFDPDAIPAFLKRGPDNVPPFAKYARTLRVAEAIEMASTVKFKSVAGA